MKKKRVIIEEKRLCIKDTIIAFMPFGFSIIIFIGFFVVGIKTIDDVIVDENFKAIAHIIWLLIMLQLSGRIIKVPETTWEVIKEEEYERPYH